MDKVLEDRMKENTIKQFEEYLIQMDENTASFEFEGTIDLKAFLDVLSIFYSDYQVRIAKTSGHPTIQVHMRLEEGLWKAR
jgi:hypothetical protein